MTIPTVNAGAAHVMLMTKRNGLRVTDATVCYVGRTPNRDGDPRDCREHKNEAEYDYARKGVCTRMKYSRHLSVVRQNEPTSLPGKTLAGQNRNLLFQAD